MLPEVGGSELLLIAAIALIVVGPKDLPILMRKVGQAMGKMRAMANEFRASFDEMARQSELEELRKEVEAMRTERLDPVKLTEDAFGYSAPVMRPLDHEFDAAAAHSAAIEANTVEEPVGDPGEIDEPTLYDPPSPAPADEPTLFDLDTPPAETRP
jgi:sec-independent protein translocase protein TatB